MQRVPVDLSGCVVLVTAPARPRTRGRGSSEQRVDAVTGAPLFEVGLVIIQPAARVSDTVTVTVAGEPSGLDVGMPAAVRGLVATPWAMEGRHGLAFRADSIVPVVPVQAGPVGRRSSE